MTKLEKAKKIGKAQGWLSKLTLYMIVKCTRTEADAIIETLLSDGFLLPVYGPIRKYEVA